MPAWNLNLVTRIEPGIFTIVFPHLAGIASGSNHLNLMSQSLDLLQLPGLNAVAVVGSGKEMTRKDRQNAFHVGVGLA